MSNFNQELAQFKRILYRNRFTGDPLRDSFPEVPPRDVLPTAGVEFAYRMIAIRGTPDVVYICLRNAGGTWGWRTAATG